LSKTDKPGKRKVKTVLGYRVRRRRRRRRIRRGRRRGRRRVRRRK
jgi:hypothetical protein